ncbi:hypothetical protein IV38_GL000125 [Lactobacillus selangorensis]|uniref:Uncharacterized protein n=1 Tax=Lactobacillus selangorensis TaxID=81857 RepID=A0A0R2FYN1_9LACO|nr:hypothetical protein [Lactobacillus selangorensis]KRN29245.1 hypothetical protein IV38_GL000125 [Lactobacillus selangorensis]KRN31397.1 hypothetical protein IV40_GL001393 [Lactobacillus selangorensis]
MAMTEAQKRAQKKYKEKTKGKQRYWNLKSSAKGFIKIATKDDLNDILKMVKEKLRSFE